VPSLHACCLPICFTTPMRTNYLGFDRPSGRCQIGGAGFRLTSCSQSPCGGLRPRGLTLQKKITGKKQHFTEFRIQLAEMMIESVVLHDYPRHGRPQQGPSPVRLQALHWAHFVQFIPPNPKKKNPCRDCVVCETRYECSKCLVALHVPDCFRVYHTTINL